MKIGILGAGQLARMLAEAGIPAGLEFMFLDPAATPSAARLGQHIQCDWQDAASLHTLADCDVVTCDFENVPASVLAQLAQQTIVRPSALAFEVAQDRLIEKQRFENLGLATPGYRAINSRPDLVAAVEQLGLPAVLKTRRFGYDGKGQFVLRQFEDLELAWQALSEHALILEQWVPFDYECAITAARNAAGDVCCYPLSTTYHEQGILRFALAGTARPALQSEAEAAIRRLMDDLDYIGCMTLELFVKGDRILANEFAPRVHNSAHWTIQGVICSQFENHLRAVCDWPLGATTSRGPALMINFIGQMPEPQPWLKIPGLSWHDYNKSARPGRKVGHATLVAHGPESFQASLTQLKPLFDARLRSAIEHLR
ncbi:MAG: 5-(carboxyamino)imidazole ribonucleotide synthase [Pseudomonadota bacterium]